MEAHARFKFKTIEELQNKVTELGLEIPFESDISTLFDSVKIGNHPLPNRFAVHPMEGFDADMSGSPQDLSFRRYQRYAAGGSALIWFEATAVLHEGRSNPNQFYLNKENFVVYKKLAEETRREALEKVGSAPLLILQLTHSGRYSKPNGIPTPIIAHHSPILDPKHNLSPNYPLITDEMLDELQEKFLSAAELAFEAGFDGIDVKSCHRYLVSELLASFTRENSRYGGSFENRTRFLREILTKIHQRFPEKIITTRMNVFDAISHPYGFGVSETDYHTPNLSEPVKLVGMLKEIGISLLNVSIGNPYFNPHFGRPFDFPIRNLQVPEEHPLIGIDRFLKITRQIQQAYPDLPVIGSGYTWLRHYMPYVAAAIVKSGGATLIGQGRGMFAYPESVNEMQKNGKMDPRKVCVTCSACTQIMRDGNHTGCVVRDSQIYGPIYREVKQRAQDVLKSEAARCRDCFYPTCQDNCPAGVEIPEFIKAFAEGDIQGAYGHLARRNLLPEICAYVCPSDVQCEGGCIEKIFSGNSIHIRDIQEAVAKAARRQGLVKINLPEKTSVKRVAVIGAGAAGLTCAASLLQQGHLVTIFDARPKPGGIVRSLLPKSRISPEQVDEEVQALLENMPADRLEWQLGKPLTTEFNLAKLTKAFDAVFLGMGLTESIHLFETAPEGVVDALKFLEQTKVGSVPKIPAEVAVIGGGNTAMDAAVAAKKLGARDVYLIYRRSFAELPAWPKERDEALNAGIHFLVLSQPVAYVVDDQNRLKSVSLARTKLGEPDASGRRRPVTLPGVASELPVQMIIEAIGQRTPEKLDQILPDIELTKNGLIKLKENTQTTSLKNVFAGGDITNGGATAVRAVADAIKAANEINDFLQSKGREHSRRSLRNGKID